MCIQAFMGCGLHLLSKTNSERHLKKKWKKVAIITSVLNTVFCLFSSISTVVVSVFLLDVCKNYIWLQIEHKTTSLEKSETSKQ